MRSHLPQEGVFNPAPPPQPLVAMALVMTVPYSNSW